MGRPLQALLLGALLLGALVPPAAASHVAAGDAAFPAATAPAFVGLIGEAPSAVAGLPANASESGCPDGQHAVPLRTYILSVPRFSVASTLGSALLELRFALSDVPAYMPLLLNRGSQGLQQGLLDAHRFLADWAALAAAGQGAMPGGLLHSRWACCARRESTGLMSTHSSKRCRDVVIA